ncbi:MAG: hypothetical protein ACKO0Z_06085 [Betaproteobacteria bacterium]
MNNLISGRLASRLVIAPSKNAGHMTSFYRGPMQWGHFGELVALAGVRLPSRKPFRPTVL